MHVIQFADRVLGQRLEIGRTLLLANRMQIRIHQRGIQVQIRVLGIDPTLRPLVAEGGRSAFDPGWH